MHRLRFALIGAAALAALPVSAHGPTPQKVVETVEIAAPVARVWESVKDFGSVGRWNPALKAAESAGGNQPGEKRTLTFANGEKLVEELDAYDPAGYTYTYRMSQPNLNALPASSYSAIFKLIPAGEGTQVEWKSRLYRGDTGNEPPEHLTDEAAAKAMQAFFQSGLRHLKATLEQSP
jgi:mxaD protein